MQIGHVLYRSFAVAVTVGALTTLGLSACGGSSGSSSSTARAGTAATGNAPQANGGSAAGSSSSQSGSSAKGGASTGRPRVTALRECLHKHGIELPTRPGAGNGLFLGGANLPKGVTRTRLQTTVRECLGGLGSLAGRPGVAARSGGGAGSPRLQRALSAFASCLRANGIAVPKPNTSGSGPVFSTKGLNTSSPQFKAATAKCRVVLAGAFGLRGARPGAPGGQPPTG